jgi:competence protein ComEA
MKYSPFLTAWLATASLGFAAADKPTLPEGPGKETMIRVCGGCHGAEIVLGKRLNRDGWSQIVVNMIQRGAQGTDDVNKATVQQLQFGLDLSDKEAAAILHYRDEKGDFKTIDDLKKVPGLDAAKIDAKRSFLAF